MNSTIKHYPRNAYLRIRRKSVTGFTLVADASHAPSTIDGVVYLAIGH